MGPKLAPHQVILSPLVTEKGTHQSTHAHHNAYAFQVNLWATKIEIKRAVEGIELYVPARVSGTLHAPEIFMDKGVQFSGNCTIAPLDQAASSAT